MPDITSVNNPRIAAAARLRDRRDRDAQRRLLIDGAREVQRALQAGVRLREIFVCDALCRTEGEAAVAALGRVDAEVFHVTEKVYRKLAFGQRNDGLIAVAETPERGLEEIALPACPLVGVLEGVEKPGNLGAVVRSADGAGLSALVAADGGTDLFNPNAIRASLGTIFSLPVCAAEPAAVLAWLREKGLAIFAARVDGSVPYTAVDYRRPAAIVLGSEASGLSDIWHAADVTAVRLPMAGIADSLNVSAAAAVLFYEARRQREGTRS